MNELNYVDEPETTDKQVIWGVRIVLGMLCSMVILSMYMGLTATHHHVTKEHTEFSSRMSQVSEGLNQ